MSKLVEKQWQFSRMIQQLLLYIAEHGGEVSFGDAWRGTDKLKIPGTELAFSYQELLKANGKSQITYSNHNKRLAIDLIVWNRYTKMLMSKEEYRPFGVYWELIGGTWGGRFGIKKSEYTKKVGLDPSHFEW